MTGTPLPYEAAALHRARGAVLAAAAAGTDSGRAAAAARAELHGLRRSDLADVAAILALHAARPTALLLTADELRDILDHCRRPQEPDR